MIGVLKNGANKGVGLIIKHLGIWITMGERFDRLREDRRVAETKETEEARRGISTAATS